MERLDQIITNVHTQQVDMAAAMRQIKQLLAEENIQEADIIEGLYKLRAKGTISDALFQLAFNNLQNPDEETVLLDLDETEAVTLMPGAMFDGDATQLAEHSDQTRVKADTLPDATRIKSDTEQTVAHPTTDPFAKTQVSTTAPGMVETVVAKHTQSATQSFTLTTAEKKPVVLRPGSIIRDRFILKEKIGAGGMSVVFKALDLRKQEAKNSNPYVAIKLLGDVFKHHPQSFLTLERESQKIQSLAHPNVVTVYDFDRDAETIYMTMECLQGQSLDAIILDNKTGLPLEKALPFIKGMCHALEYAHSKNIIHSDFKPENVFFTQEKVVKVLDFGIARAKQLPDAKASSATAFDAGSLGALTPPYASCEMFEHKDPDPRDDIYALGCVTYKLLTGVHPFGGLPSVQARDAGLQPKKVNSITRRQWQTIAQSLAFERDARVPSVSEFYQGVAPRKLSPWMIASFAIMALAIGLGAYFWTIYQQKPSIPLKKLTVEQQQKVKHYLEIAELYMSMGYFASPPGDSALDQYERVLAINPGDQNAIKGKTKIAREYEKMAREKLELGDISQGLQLVKTGLFVKPDDEGLLTIKKALEDKQNLSQ